MANELLAVLLHMNLAAAGAVLAVLAVRGFARRRFGAGFGYRLWACVPVAALAALFPPPAARWSAAPTMSRARARACWTACSAASSPRWSPTTPSTATCQPARWRG